MKKAAIFVILFIIVLSFFVFVPINNDSALSICGAYAVPGMYYSDLKGIESTVEVLEKDTYGRIMFIYSAPSVITEQNESAVVICQKKTNDFVYFYEDICYEFVETEITNENTKFLEIKDRNDWNKPLSDEKMTFRRIKVSFDNVIITEVNFDVDRIKEICCESLGIYDFQIKEFCIDDVKPDESCIFFLKTNSNGNEKKYFAKVEKEYNVSFYEINDDI